MNTERLKILNNSKFSRISSNVLIVILNLILISIFAKFFSIKFDLDNPLIPKDLIALAFEPFAKKGFIVSIALLSAIVLKFSKQNLLAILISVIAIVIFLFTENNIGNWNTVIN